MLEQREHNTMIQFYAFTQQQQKFHLKQISGAYE